MAGILGLGVLTGRKRSRRDADEVDKNTFTGALATRRDDISCNEACTNTGVIGSITVDASHDEKEWKHLARRYAAVARALVDQPGATVLSVHVYERQADDEQVPVDVVLQGDATLMVSTLTAVAHAIDTSDPDIRFADVSVGSVSTKHGIRIRFYATNEA